MSEVRVFVRAWRPTTSEKRTAGGQGASEDMEDGGFQVAQKKPSSDALLKLAQVRRHASLEWRVNVLGHWRSPRYGKGSI